MAILNEFEAKTGRGFFEDPPLPDDAIGNYRDPHQQEVLATLERIHKVFS